MMLSAASIIDALFSKVEINAHRIHGKHRRIPGKIALKNHLENLVLDRLMKRWRPLKFEKSRMELNELSFIVRGCIFQVYKELGPGLLESVYEHALIYELGLQGLQVKHQVGLPVKYKEVELNLGFRIDLIVEDAILIEIKSVEALHDVFKKQLLTYLKLSGKKLGMLVNFNVTILRDKISLIRIIN